MRVEAVDFFYLSMPEVLDIGDGSQDALLVRVVAGGEVGWGECEAAPLPSIASLVCPMSHSACKPVQDSVLGARLEAPDDIRAIGDAVRANSLDLLQADHTLSGIDMALWDLLGKHLGEPVWRLLGWPQAYPKMPYFSVLFGDTPEETGAKARQAHATWLEEPFVSGALEAYRALALAMTRSHLLPDGQGMVRVPDAPGLGLDIDAAGLKPYLVDTEIRVKGRTLYQTPSLD